MALYKIPWSGNGDQNQILKTQQNEILRIRGGSRKPAPPRSIIAQPGNGKVLLNWNADPSNHPLSRTRVYLDTEDSLYDERPAGVFRIEVPATGGPTPIPRNIFLSFVTPLGAESRKVPVQQAAAAQANGAAPPADPPPPTGWSQEPTGGAFNKNISHILIGAK